MFVTFPPFFPSQTHQLHYLMSLVGFKAPSLFQGYAKGRAASDQVMRIHRTL
jgi:hypothetical protein